MNILALLQWRPHLEPIWCGLLIVAAGLWIFVIYRRLLKRLPTAKVRLVLLPKICLLLLLLLALFDPVSALQKRESSKGKLLVMLDTSSSMEVADDPRGSRITRARRVVEDWRKTLPQEITIDELEFDTQIHQPPSTRSSAGLRGTDLGGCLLGLSERPDLSSYQAVVLMTDGGDEPVESAALPPVPLSVVGIASEPATWNDVSIADVQFPTTVEKDVNFEISADLQAYTGKGGSFVPELSQVKVILERLAGSAWEKVAEQNLNLANKRARAKFPANSQTTGLHRYRISADPLPGELSPLNNSRTIAVDVQKKSLHILYFTRDLGQEFKTLRNELGRDPGISFTALIRTIGERFMLQGQRLPGDTGLETGFPAHKKGLGIYDLVIIGSFPAEECSREQMQALIEYVENGGVVIFLGGEKSFGRGGYANTPLAALFPWNLSDREPEPATGIFPVLVPPAAAGHPIISGLEEMLVKGGAVIESANRVEDLKPGATGLLTSRLGQQNVAVVGVQLFGKGKVLAVASNTLWKWATKPEPLRTAYGLFWRQAVRNLSGKTDGGQNLAVKWDREFYRPGEQAVGEIRVLGQKSSESLRFSASLTAKEQSHPLTVEPAQGQTNAFAVNILFRERGEYGFRLVVYQADRVLESYEKTFAVAPLAPEGSRLELDEVFLQKLAERGGGTFRRENDTEALVKQFSTGLSQKTIVLESSLIEAGPWFALVFLFVLVVEWALRRRLSLI